MNVDWIKAGETGQPHWKKLAGSTYYTTACQVIIPRGMAVTVPTHSVGMAGRPGVTIQLPDQDEACEVCLQKARAQA